MLGYLGLEDGYCENADEKNNTCRDEAVKRQGTSADVM
jgi:hypothetical protein